MKTATIREFRSNLAELIESREPILITRHGKSKAVLYPIADIRSVCTLINDSRSMTREDFETIAELEIIRDLNPRR